MVKGHFNRLFWNKKGDEVAPDTLLWMIYTFVAFAIIFAIIIYLNILLK